MARVGAWRSLVAHLFWEQRVVSSNLAAPTTGRKPLPLAGRFRATVGVSGGVCAGAPGRAGHAVIPPGAGQMRLFRIKFNELNI